MKPQSFFGVLLVTIMVLLLPACASPVVTTSSPQSTETDATAPAPDETTVLPATQPPARGGIVTEAIATDAKSFHIYQTTDIASRDFQFRVYASGLWQRDPTTNLPIPYMAESWSVSDDGKTYTFKLRSDMKWSDGVPITAQDFVWTFDQAVKPENNYPYVSILAGIASYTAPDESTIVITLKDASCAGILVAGQITPLPEHTWGNLSWSDPEENPEILNPSVVSGPWKLQEWKRDEYAVFVPNELYFGGVPLLDSYVVRIVPDASIRLQMLKTGEVDYAAVSAGDYAGAQQSDNLKTYSWDPAQPTWYFAGFNFNQALLQDIEMRHALSYAMPQQLIADKVFNGLAKPTYTTYSPPNWVYDPNVPKYNYDIAMAQGVLESAGYKLDEDGRRLDKNGDPIKLRIFFPSTDIQREQIATIAQEEWGKLGIGSEIIGMESKALFDLLQNSPDKWDVWIGLARDTSDPHFTYQAWSESTIPQINTGAYINKAVEDLFVEGNAPPCDTNRRREIYQQIQQIISDDSPYVFLVYNSAFAFVNKRVVVNPPSALGINYRINEWYVLK